MRVFTFQSATGADVIAFTADQTGGNLPNEFAPWTPVGDQMMQSGTSLAGVGRSDLLMAAIEQDGFYVARSAVLVSRQTDD